MYRDIKDGRYDSVQEFVANVMQPLRNPDNKDQWDICGRADFKGWFGGDCDTRDDVVVRLRDGWPAGQKIVDELSQSIDNSISAIPMDRRRKMRRGDFGDELDIHAVYRGRCDIAWTRPVRSMARGPQMIEVICNAQANWTVPQEHIMWCGVASIVLARKLELAGYRVKLSRGSISEMITSPSERSHCLVTIKDYSKPIDIATMAAVTMPGFFRAMILSWEVVHSRYKVRSGVSRSIGIKPEAGKVVVPNSVTNKGLAIAFINETINKVNEGKL